MSTEESVTALYRRLIGGWNSRDADAMSAVLTRDALVIGYDGSVMEGRDAVARDLGAVFADHETANYVSKVRSITPLGSDAALLHAVVGMIPPGGTEILPERNAVQTVVALRGSDGWAIALFHNTPAQFHGRPELAEALTAELRALT